MKLVYISKVNFGDEFFTDSMARVQIKSVQCLSWNEKFISVLFGT